MRKIKLSKDYCTYIIVSADSTKELERKVTEIVEQGWQTENLVNGGWELLGGMTSDGTKYYQTMVKRPKSYSETARNSTGQNI